LNEMDTDWGVSSFDEYEYQGRAQEMDVLSRWKIMIGDSQFHQFLDSFEKHRAAVLADGIFGPVPIVT